MLKKAPFLSRIAIVLSNIKRFTLQSLKGIIRNNWKIVLTFESYCVDWWTCFNRDVKYSWIFHHEFSRIHRYGAFVSKFYESKCARRHNVLHCITSVHRAVISSVYLQFAQFCEVTTCCQIISRAHGNRLSSGQQLARVLATIPRPEFFGSSA